MGEIPKQSQIQSGVMCPSVGNFVWAVLAALLGYYASLFSRDGSSVVVVPRHGSGIRFFVDRYGQSGTGTPMPIGDLLATNYHKLCETNCYSAKNMQELRRIVKSDLTLLPDDLSDWFLNRALAETNEKMHRKVVRRFSSSGEPHNKSWSFVGFWETHPADAKACIGIYWLEFNMPSVRVGERPIRIHKTDYNEKCIANLVCKKEPVTTVIEDIEDIVETRVLSLSEHQQLEEYMIHQLVTASNATLNHYNLLEERSYNQHNWLT